MNPEETSRLAEAPPSFLEETESLGRALAAGDKAGAQVLFYDRGARDFAFAWAAARPAGRWLFPVSPQGPQFLYYVCMRLQQQGHSAAHVLIAAAGQGALFYATAAPAEASSPGVIGLLPLDTPPADFGTTLGAYAPGATLTLLTSATAGDSTFEGAEYEGAELVGLLAVYTSGKVVAADQAVVWNADGTASTTGNIWVGDPATGVAAILCPAPADGAQQNFPLDPRLFRG